MMKSKGFILFLFLPLFLSACDTSSLQPNSKEKKEEALRHQEKIIVEKSSEEAVSQKPVFLYSKQMGTIISLNNEPVETLLGFVRVAGVMSGAPARALLEIGGKGVLIARGEALGPYKVEKISEKEVILCLNK